VNNHNTISVAFILPSLRNTGPIILVHNLIQALGDKIRAEVFYFDPLVELNFDVPNRQIGFFEKIDFSNYDLVHSHMLRPDLYCAFHKLYKQVKVLSTLHQYLDKVVFNNYNPFVFNITRWLWIRALRKFHFVVCINPEMQIRYRLVLLPAITELVFNGISNEINEAPNAELLNTLNSIKNKYTLIGTVSLLVKVKGLEQIIPLIANNKHLFWVVIGDGSEKNNLVSLAKSYGIINRVLFLGTIAKAKLYMPFLDVYAMPSRSEGFGMSLVEAVSLKVPVVCSSIPAFNSMFTSTEVNFFELDNLESIVNSVAIATSTAGSEKVKMAYAKYVKHYHVSEMARQYNRLYQMLKNTK
jgi:glycosyltransferase involved in cell wall biosynthesis